MGAQAKTPPTIPRKVHIVGRFNSCVHSLESSTLHPSNDGAHGIEEGVSGVSGQRLSLEATELGVLGSWPASRRTWNNMGLH
jgi:hypothetical protein